MIGLTADAVRGSLQAIATGHPGFDLIPKVTGHQLLPGAGGAVFGPELTVLNVMTGDIDLTTHNGRMLALTSIRPAPDERRELYTRYIKAVAPQSAREALEELMRTVIKDPFIDGFIAQGEAIGLAKGKAEGEARLFVRYLGTRFSVPAPTRERIMNCLDTAQIEAWFDRATSATTLDEIFAV